MLLGEPTGQVEIIKLDERPVPGRPGEIRCFACLRNEALRLPFFLEHHRKLGVDRFFIIDNYSNDGSREFLLSQPDCHTFHCEGNYFAENVTPPAWTNRHLNLFGDGHWCLTVDPDELLVYPHYEHVSLREFCAFLDRTGADALFVRMLDMYAKGAITRNRYKAGQSFLQGSPYFDSDPGWIKPLQGHHPPIQIFGGVRERVFWRGRYKRGLPPCLSKVPLAKWRKGKRYVASMHLISHANLSEVTGALLHFKFLTGFLKTMTEQVTEHAEVREKGLEEHGSYVEALRKDPNLTLWNEASVRYRGSQQLVQLGLIKTTAQYESFVADRKAPRKRTGGGNKVAARRNRGVTHT